MYFTRNVFMKVTDRNIFRFSATRMLSSIAACGMYVCVCELAWCEARERVCVFVCTNVHELRTSVFTKANAFILCSVCAEGQGLLKIVLWARPMKSQPKC